MPVAIRPYSLLLSSSSCRHAKPLCAAQPSPGIPRPSPIGLPVRRAPGAACYRTLCILLGLLAWALLAGGCGKGNAPAVGGPGIAVDDLPPGVGRGYPTAMLLGESQPTGAPEVGDPAPGFALQLDDGRTLTSDYLKGRPVVINHWATWCPPCRVEMPELVRAAGERPDVVFIAVNNMEPRDKVEPFAAEYGLNFLVALDPEAHLNDLYAVRALPTTFFIDRQGKLAAVWEGVLSAEKLAELLALIE